MPEVLQVGISWEYDYHLLLSSSKEIAKILPCREFFVWTPLPSGACQLTQSHSTNGPPRLDRLPDRLRRQWRHLVQTFLKWYRDNLLCLVCTDKWQASLLTLLVLPSQFPEQVRFRMKLNVSRDTLKVFLNLASEKVLQTFSHQPVFLFSRRQERTGRGTVMFLWEISNDRRQVKFKNRFLLATRLLNANCIWSGLLLPSLIGHARKTSSSFPQFAFPAIFFAMFKQ